MIVEPALGNAHRDYSRQALLTLDPTSAKYSNPDGVAVLVERQLPVETEVPRCSLHNEARAFRVTVFVPAGRKGPLSPHS